MKIELTAPARAEAITSLQRYFAGNMPEELGTLPATMLLDYVLAEIGPAIYNRAVADAQARLQARVAELDSELYADEFPFWKPAGPARGRR